MVIEAKQEHAHVVCDIVKNSIQKLCITDYKNDPGILEPWLSNKTPENFRLWIKSKNSMSFVAIFEEAPIGFSLIGKNGHIYLCYMHPDKVGMGLGKQLLSACENQALTWGLKKMTVDSSGTAKTFYESQGFKSSDNPFTEDNLCSYPLAKQLQP